MPIISYGQGVLNLGYLPHRIGRTGRAGKNGKAISFAAPEQKRDIFTIERLVRTHLPIKPLPKMDKHIITPIESERKRRFGNRSSRSRNFGPKKGGHQPFKRGRRRKS